MSNKRAQISDTMTWVVATILIILILASSIFAISFLPSFKDKTLTKNHISDLIVTKSLSAYLLTKDEGNKNIIYNQLKEKDLDDFNGKLATSIFKEFYQKDYPDVVISQKDSLRVGIWIGIPKESLINFNKYFLKKPSILRSNVLLTFTYYKFPPFLLFSQPSFFIVPHIQKKIKLNNDRVIDFLLIKNE